MAVGAPFGKLFRSKLGSAQSVRYAHTEEINQGEQMKKIRKENYWELAAFLMDYHTGQWSRGYRLLCRLGAQNFSTRLCEELRDTECYQYLVNHYAKSV